jgi:hypothetical protein
MKRMVSAVFILLFCSAAVAGLQRHHLPTDNSPQKGPKDAPVTIIEFLDFQ